MTRPLVAFLGIGIMGLPMCRHILKAGYPVKAWNRTRAKAEELAADGAQVCDTVEEALQGASFAICMLENGPVIDQVLFESRAVEQLKPGATLIVMSSIPVDTTQRQAQILEARSVSYIDAPVSGGQKGAVGRTLTIMAGGAPAVIEQSRALLETMGRVTHVGPVGSGQLSKLANQLIVGITIGAVAEALALAKTGGADQAAVRAALLGGFADSTILRQHGERMVTGNFEPGGRATIQLKDLRTARVLAEQLGIELPMLRLAEEQYKRLCDLGHADLDHSALYLLLGSR